MAVLAAINSSVNFFEAFQKKRIAPGKAVALAAHPFIDAPFEALLVGTAKRLWTQKWVVAEAVVIILLMDWACASAAIQAGYMALSAIHGAAAK
ncbi:hypothetical protein A6456_36160 [Paraburkholderia tropica]|nr:hypothetical protein A6456_36160 [Paraburkholderia tropica]